MSNFNPHVKIGSSLMWDDDNDQIDARILISVTDPRDSGKTIEVPFEFDTASAMGASLAEAVGHTKQMLAIARLLQSSGKGKDEVADFLTALEQHVDIKSEGEPHHPRLVSSLE